MQIKKFMVCASVLMVVSSVSMAGQAANKQDNITPDSKDNSQKKAVEKAEPKAPMVIQADNLKYNEETGDLFAEGNVVVTKNTDTILTDAMRGNSKQTEVWVDGKATLQQPGTNLVGTSTHYNYTTHVGNMKQVKGLVGKEYMSGENMELFPDKLIAHNGTATKCPAIVPDYHMSAERIEVWPGEKMIAYNAKFWIKNMVIYSVPKYETSLVKGEGETPFPRIGYNSSDGFRISQYLEYPIADRLAAFGELKYYSKDGFKPTYGLIDRQKNYTLKLYNGKLENSDDEWIKIESEFMLTLKPQRFGKVVGSFTASNGKWIQGDISGWRQDYKLYFQRDSIQLSKKVTLDVGTGYERALYGYNKTVDNIWSFDTRITAKPNDRLETWVGYSYRNESGKSVYDYDKIDIPRELTSGVTYKVDKLNSVGVKVDYDLDRDTVKDIDYTWSHNLHCFDADLTYRAKRGQWNVKVAAVKW